MKTTCCLPVVLFLCLIAIPSGGQAQCGNSVWSSCEFCGRDAWAAVNHAEMNHDCMVDVIDVGLFAQALLYNYLSGDFSGNGVVNAADLAFLANCLVNHPQVAPCDSCNTEPVACGGTVRVTFSLTTADLDEITLDPDESRMAQLIAENTQGLAGFIGCLATSPNVVIEGYSPRGTVDLGGYGSGRCPPVATNDPVSVKGFTFHVTDSEPAYIEPADCDLAGQPLGWSTVSPPQRYLFSTIASGGVNGPPPADRHRDCLLTGVPDTESVSRIWTFPNPAGAAVFFGLPTSWRADTSLDVRVYDVRGARIRSFTTRASAGIVAWDGQAANGLRAPAGAYIVVFAAGGRTISAKVTLTK